MRFLVRSVVALLAVLGFMWLVDHQAWVVVAAVLIALAVVMLRGSLRVLPPLDVPVPHAAFPDPPREERG